MSMDLTRRHFVMAGAVSVALAAGQGWAAGAKVTEKDVEIKTPDGTADAVLFHPASGKGPWPAVILWHDLAGLRPVFRDMARKLAAEGFVVLTPNAFYRSLKATGAEINMADPEVRKVQTTYRTAATDDGIARDAVAYVAWLDGLKQVARKKKIGTHGYDVGASYAFRAAAAVPGRIGAVGCLYGLGVATPRPNSPHLLVGKTRAAYYVAQARDDDAREPDDKTDISKAIADAKLEGTVEVYPTDHGWAVPGAHYDAASAERAAAAVLKLYKAKLV